MKSIQTAAVWLAFAGLTACSGGSDDIWADPVSTGGRVGESGAAGSAGTNHAGSGGGTGGTSTGNDELLVFVLDPARDEPITLHAVASAVTRTDDGFRIAGTLSIDTEFDPVLLRNADVRLRYDADAGEGLQHIEGTVSLPLPKLAIFGDANLGAVVPSRIGYELGEDLRALGGADGPLLAGRKYLSFAATEPFHIDFGSVELSSPAAGDGSAPVPVFALDPSDPQLFLRGSLSGVLGKSESARVAISATRLFMLRHEAEDEEAEGYLWVEGELDCKALSVPITIDGHTLFEIDPDQDGTSILADPHSEVAFGASGELRVKLEVHARELEVPVVSAWLEASALGGAAEATYVGGIAANSSFWPDGYLIENPKALRVHGKNGSDASTDFLAIEGQLIVAGVDLSQEAHGQLDANGLNVSGRLATARNPIALSGSVEPDFVQLSGEAEVTIAISGERTTETTVTDAELCGTEAVTDAELCGLVTVTDAEACGADTVTDQAVCGTAPVTDPQLCGTTVVTSAALCGVHSVTDAILCGSTTIPCSRGCDFSENCNCTTANTCNVPSTCSVAATCEVPATCDVPRTCETAATCDRPKTCVVTERAPDADLGEFRGSARLRVTPSGLGGSVSGSYCVRPADCTRATNGRITHRDGIPRACITLPDLGESCTRL